MSISVQETRNLIDELKEKEISLGRDPSTWYTYKSTFAVRLTWQKKIASHIDTMDEDRVYVVALLHDICRTDEDRDLRFHGILGYEKLKEKDELAARSSLTHMFEWHVVPPFDVCSDLFFGNKKDYDFVANYIKNTSLNDIDLLIQLADNMANKNGIVTIEQRMNDLLVRGRIESIQEKIGPIKEIKLYFDKKVGKDIYGLLFSKRFKNGNIKLTDEN